MKRISTVSTPQDFGAVGIILASLAIGLVGGSGWYVWQKNSTKQVNVAQTDVAVKPATSTRTAVEPKATVPAEQNIFKIPELGIQMILPSSVNDLVYEIFEGTSHDGDKGYAAIISTKSIMAAHPECTLRSASIGSIGKIKGQYPTGKDISPIDYGQLAKQFPDFYLSLSFPNGGGDCQIFPQPNDPAISSWESMLKEAAASAELLNN